MLCQAKNKIIIIFRFPIRYTATSRPKTSLTSPDLILLKSGSSDSDRSTGNRPLPKRMEEGKNGEKLTGGFMATAKNNTIPLILVLILSLPVVFILGCEQAYYPTMRVLGQNKRTQVVDKIKAARDAEEKAKKQFDVTMKKFSYAVSSLKNGKPRKNYKTLGEAIKKSSATSAKFKKKVDDAGKTAKKFFREWEDELQLYTNEELRRASEKKMDDTRKQCYQVLYSMKYAEAKIKPVITALNDYVLLLKHDLGPYSATSINEKLSDVMDKIADLIKAMNNSISDADILVDRLNSEAIASK